MSRKIKKIVTRFPNLECGFLAALLAYCVQAARHLNITTGKIDWEFISTASKVDNPDDDDGIIYYNVGGSELDQHGKKENQSICRICSLDLIRRTYDFLKGRPWIVEVFELIRNNDIKGTRISRHRHNLRELMTALSFKYQDNPQLVMDFLTLAFCGVFERCKAGVNIKKVFDPKEMKQGVADYCPEKLDWFEKLLLEAIETVNRHWSWAHKMVAKAEELGKTRSIYVPSMGCDIKVIEVFCDSFKTGAAGRGKGYQVVIQWNRDGHCQIHGGNITEEAEGTIVKKWIHMGRVAARLRLMEAKFSGRRIKDDQDWSKGGVVLFDDDTPIPWYLPEFMTSLYNGTMSSMDIAKTKINRGNLLGLVCTALKQCEMIVQIGDNDRQIVNPEMAMAD